MRIYGYRTSKTVNGTTTDYTLEGSKVLIEKTGSDCIWYYYDAAGAPAAMATGSGPSLYIYRKNLQGDITGIYSGSTGTLLVSYVYDAWGKVTATNVAGTTESATVLARNPYLYRGYRYDATIRRPEDLSMRMASLAPDKANSAQTCLQILFT